MAAHDFLEEGRSDRATPVAHPNERAGGASGEHTPAPAPGSRAVTSAASVLHLQRSVGNAGTAAYLQRLATGEVEETQEAEAAERSPVHDTIASGGTALEPATRSAMEQSLGADFSSVRLHVDAKSAESVQAAAYTVGEDIVVHPSHFSAGTPQAQRTLAHELTHVVQQRSGPVAGTPREGGVQVSDPSDRFEQEAERTAERVTSGESSNDQSGDGADAATPGSVQRSTHAGHDHDEDREIGI